MKWVVDKCRGCGSKDKFSIEENDKGKMYFQCNKCGWRGNAYGLDVEEGRIPEHRSRLK